MSRTRKRIAVQPKRKGIPVAILGEPFEWTDSKLKIALESYSGFKRLAGDARLSMVLSLGMYYDDVLKKWLPLSSAAIATVQTQARYYTATPPALTINGFYDLRMSNAQELLVKDDIARSYLFSIAGSNAAIQVQTDKFNFAGTGDLEVNDNLLYGIIQSQQAILLAIANDLDDIRLALVPLIFEGDIAVSSSFYNDTLEANYLFRSITVALKSAGTLDVLITVFAKFSVSEYIQIFQEVVSTGTVFIKGFELPPFDSLIVSVVNQSGVNTVYHRTILSEKEGLNIT